MKLYKYEKLEKLNEALEQFEKDRTPISKVKLLTESSYEGSGKYSQGEFSLKTVYFILTDNKRQYQRGGKTKAEDEPMPW